ncbi:MAG: hypothetical protein LBT41_04040 [Candidatus Methanoplasma sp.]|nr:hypothetical protein [Candidatus Methanoplasma sp.]
MAHKDSGDAKKSADKGPKASARHAKIARSKKDEIEILKKKIASDHRLAKEYEAKKRDAIYDLPKEERKAAKAELKEAVAGRKEAERKDRDALRDMIHGEKAEKRAVSKAAVNDDEWVEGGRKKPKEGKS